jgi:F0F1-type ATP synthase membrane subunit a
LTSNQICKGKKKLTSRALKFFIIAIPAFVFATVATAYAAVEPCRSHP